jgi:hypothetical protein
MRKGKGYDIKIFEGQEEQETIRGLTYGQAFVIATVLKRYNIEYLIKGYANDSVWVGTSFPLLPVGEQS